MDQTGGPGNDVLTGTPDDEVLNGVGGNDTLIGVGGHDTLIGEDGNDTLDARGSAGSELIGGLDNDIYLVDNSADTLIEQLGEGTDEVRTTLTTYALVANVENLTY